MMKQALIAQQRWDAVQAEREREKEVRARVCVLSYAKVQFRNEGR